MLKRTLLVLAVPVAFGVAPGAAGAATISAGPSGIVYAGGDDANEVRVRPSEQGDLLFEERNGAIAITNLVASCAVDSGVSKHQVRCETPGTVFEVDAGGRGDTRLHRPLAEELWSGHALRGEAGSDRLAGRSETTS